MAKVVIIGGVAGGASCAARLRRLDEEMEIVLLERGPYISYANCGLPYHVGGVIASRGALLLQTPRAMRDRFNVDVRVQNEAVSIDRANKTVTVKRLDTGETYAEQYDTLVLATGSSPVRPPIPGIDSPRVQTLWTVPDTDRIREHIKADNAKSAVIVGGGFIGLEMAENLHHVGLKVTIVEALDQVMAPLDFEMALLLHEHLAQKGVGLHLSDGVASFEDAAEQVTVTLKSGTKLPTDLVILSIGVRPNGELAKAAGLEVNARGGIVVSAAMQTSDPAIYAVGDAVEVEDFIDKSRTMIPLAGPANKQGRIAADNIAGLGRTYKGTQGTSILKLFDMTVGATGLNESAAGQAGLDCDKVYLLADSHAGYYPGAQSMSVKVLFEKPTGRILGAQLVGFGGVDKRLDVLAAAIRGGMTAEDLSQLELAYAPPFSSAKDPVNMVGFMIENLLEGTVKQFHWQEAAGLLEAGHTLVDVRTPAEYAQGHIDGAVNIPVDDLRGRLDELDPRKPVYVYCQSGQRSYLACRILTGRGFAASHLAGGYRLYASARLGHSPAFRCDGCQ